jgi:hypothetical protein
VLYTGSYIPQFCLSAVWSRIHGAPVVHIEAVFGRQSSMAGYLAKYMAKENLNGRGYSWSWGWCHLGVCRAWRWFRRGASAAHASFCDLLETWHYHIRSVRLLESFYGLAVGHLRVLTEGGTLVYDCGSEALQCTFCDIMRRALRKR